MALRPKQTTVHLLPSFHYDVAYLKTFKGYLPESLGIIKTALKLLDRHRDFTYCIEQVVLVREYWKRYPADRVLLRKFARQGRLVFAPGMFTMPDTNIPSGESFIRNALIGRQWLKANLDVEPECCWMADIFGHSPQSPQLAGTCGYRLFMFERGRSGAWDTTFNWKGIDGSKIATQWEIDTYAGMYMVLAFADRPYAWLANRVRAETIGLLKKYGADPQTVFTTLGHDFLPPKQEYIDFLRKWNRRERDIRFVFSTPYRYLAALHEQKVPLKILSEDMNPLCEGCFSSRIRIKQYNRRLEETAASLEMLECHTGMPHRESEALWEVLAYNAFHDIICGTLVAKAAEETLKMYARAENRAGKAIGSLLAKAIRLKAPAKPAAAKLLFNSLPYARREIVEIKPHKFAAIDLPASGFASSRGSAGKNVFSDAVKVGADGMSLENRLLRVKLADNGTIGSLYDKVNRQELALPHDGMNNPMQQADHGDLWSVFQGPINGGVLRNAPLHQPRPLSGVHPDRTSRIGCRAGDADAYSWPTPVIIDRDPLQGTLEISYKEIGLVTRITLRAGEKMARFHTKFMPKGKKYRLRVAFPTSITKGVIRHSTNCGHIERPEGEYGAQGWMDYADKNKGLLVLNRGLPGNNVTDGVMMLSLFRAVSMEAYEETGWFEEGIEQTFEYALVPFSPRDPHYNPARLSALFNRPLCELPVAADGLNACLLKQTPFVSLSGDAAELSCIKRENGGLIVRVWESRGRRSEIGLTFADDLLSADRTDATGKKLSALRVAGTTLNLRLKPFEIATLAVTITPV